MRIAIGHDLIREAFRRQSAVFPGDVEGPGR